MGLAAQCEIPPHVVQYPFEIESQWGVSHAFCLVFAAYRASIAEVPLLWGGGIAPPLRILSRWGNAQKRGRGYHTELPMLRHPIPHSAQ